MLTSSSVKHMLYARGCKHYFNRCFIHGIVLGKWFKAGFNWIVVYNNVSEVNGNAPKTEIFRRIFTFRYCWQQ